MKGERDNESVLSANWTRPRSHSHAQATSAHAPRQRRCRPLRLSRRRLRRGFVEGKRKGRCPYQLLALKLPTCDPWALLQLDPDQLEQHLSSSQLAA
jgi:hypothetical protein